MRKFKTDRVWLTGSRREIERVIYQDGERFFVKWYGNMIQVEQGRSGFYTVEMY